MEKKRIPRHREIEEAVREARYEIQIHQKDPGWQVSWWDGTGTEELRSPILPNNRAKILLREKRIRYAVKLLGLGDQYADRAIAIPGNWSYSIKHACKEKQ